nr:RHS repeat-associated core domain-containing protein [uncultured Roseateles sp.]
MGKKTTFSRCAILLCLLTQAVQAQSLPPLPQSPAPVANYEYDAEGNPTKTVAAPGVSGFGFATSHGYDPLGRRSYTVDAKTGLTQFSYDGQSRLTQVKDPRNLNTQYPLNGLGDPTGLVSPDTGTSAFTYDAAGNLKTSADARGYLSTYSYDALNRPTSRVITKTGTTTRQFSWTYDQTGGVFGYGVGRLTAASSPEVSTQYGYDAQGRITRVTQAVQGGLTQTVAYTYDAASHVTSITYPSGRVVSYSYVDGQPSAINVATSAGATPQPLISQIQMSPFGPVKSWKWHMTAGLKLHERSFDANGRMVRYPLGPLVRDLSYDAADRIKSYTHYNADGTASTAYNQSFGYDAMGQVSSVQTAATNWAYTYDANGNRTSAATGTGSRSYTVAADSNRLNSITNPVRNFTVDASGNTLSDTAASLSTNYGAAYSPEGRLMSLAQGSYYGVDFVYDALGQRVKNSVWSTLGASASRSVNAILPQAAAHTKRSSVRSAASSMAGSTAASVTATGFDTFVAYDLQGHLLGEYWDNGVALSEYVWFGDIPVAVLIPNAGSSTQPPTQFYIHGDHLDAPRVAVDVQGRMRWRWMSEPFGTAPPENAPTPGLEALDVLLRLPGQQFERVFGLHYNYFRDYDPTTGRYVQSDPIGLDGGLNTYAYVEGNPLSYIDPTGACPWCVAAGIGALTDLTIQLYFNGFNLKCVNWWEVAGSGAAAGLGVGVLEKLAKLGKLGIYSTKTGGPTRPTYRFFKSKDVVRVESHPISKSAPDWLSYPHWHADFLGKPWSKIHTALIEPVVGVPAAAYNAMKDDCECQR